MHMGQKNPRHSWGNKCLLIYFSQELRLSHVTQLSHSFTSHHARQGTRKFAGRGKGGESIIKCWVGQSLAILGPGRNTQGAEKPRERSKTDPKHPAQAEPRPPAGAHRCRGGSGTCERKRPCNLLRMRKNIWPWVKIQIVPPVNIPIPTDIGSKMGGKNSPTPNGNVQNGFDHHSHFSVRASPNPKTNLLAGCLWVFASLSSPQPPSPPSPAPLRGGACRPQRGPEVQRGPGGEALRGHLPRATRTPERVMRVMRAEGRHR